VPTRPGRERSRLRAPGWVHASHADQGIRAKTVDQDERGNAERRALFVGLWPPMFWMIGDSLKQHE
jgi:hypothetical protein